MVRAEEGYDESKIPPPPPTAKELFSGQRSLQDEIKESDKGDAKKATEKDENRKTTGYSYVCTNCKYTSKDLTSMSVHVKDHGKKGKFEIKYDYELANDKAALAEATAKKPKHAEKTKSPNKPVESNSKKSVVPAKSEDHNIAKRIAQEILATELKDTNKNQDFKDRMRRKEQNTNSTLGKPRANTNSLTFPKQNPISLDPLSTVAQETQQLEEDPNREDPNDPLSGSALFKCLACPEKFVDQEHLVLHFQKEHDEGEKHLNKKDKDRLYDVLCYICLWKTPELGSMDTHILDIHFGDLKCTCPHCPNVYSSPKELQQHGDRKSVV